MDYTLCTECEHKMEVLIEFKNDSLLKCPNCGLEMYGHDLRKEWERREAEVKRDATERVAFKGEKKVNRFYILCPRCGNLVCYKCAQYEDRLHALTEDSPDKADERIYKAWDKHKAEYQQDYIGSENKHYQYRLRGGETN
jgi:predicted RNA-binding Zn-ribbon protein involved in translation (DUF1610 family)